MPDIAELGIVIRSAEAEVAEERLDKLATTGGKAEKAVESLGSTAGATASKLGSLAASGVASAAATDKGSSAATGYTSAAREMAEAINAQVAADTRAIGATNELTASMGRASSAAPGLAGGLNAATASYEQFYDAASRDFAVQWTAQAQAAAAGAGNLSARVTALTASVNPLAATQARLNAELAEAKALYAAGALSAEQYAAAETILAARINAAAIAQKNYEAAAAKTVVSNRLATHETANFGRQLADIGVQGAMGMSPLMILIQQGPQIADIFSTAAKRGVTFKAALAGIAAEFGPLLGMAALIAALAAPFVILGVAAKAYSDEVKAAETATMGLGRAAGISGDELIHLADASAKAGDISVQAARKGAEAFVSAGIANHEVIAGLVEIQRRYALATGQDATSANAELAKSFANLTTGVGTLDSKLNFLDGTTRQHILDLAKQSDQTAAQKEALILLQGELDGTTAALDRNAGGWHRAAVAAQNYFDSLGQMFNPGLQTQIDNLQNTLDLAKAAPNPVPSYIRRLTAQLQGLQAQKGINDMILQGAAAKKADNLADKDAIDNYRTLVPIEAQRADIEDRLDKARKNRAEGRITQVQLDKAEASAKLQLAQLNRREAGPRDPDAGRIARLGRENEAIEETITNNLKLAEAYKTSDAAAMRQADVTKATAAAIKDRGDVEEYIARQIRLTASEQAVAGAQTTADLNAQTKARRAAYADVAAGKITMAEANQQITNELALRKLNAAYANAEGDAKIALKGIIDDLTQAQKDSNDAALEGAQASVLAGYADQLDMLRLEVELIGAGNRERAVKLAQMKAEQDERARGYNPDHATPLEKDQHDKIVAGAGDVAAATYDAEKAQADYNAELERGVKYMDELASQASDAASAMSDAFDGTTDSLKGVVKGIGDLMKIMSNYSAQQARIAADRKRLADDDATTVTDMVDFETKAYSQTSQARIQSYGDMAAAGKQFFDKSTAGYKAMEAAEIAFRTIQMLMAIKAMGLEAAATATHAAQSGIRTSISAVEAYVKTLASLPFPYNVAAGAVVLAAMAAVGVSITGGGGGAASAAGANDAQHRQDAQGAGSVLGDTKAKTASIVNSLELVADHTNKMLEFYNPMLVALRSIDDQIGTVAAALAKSLGVGGMLDTSRLGLGESSSRGLKVGLGGGLLGGAMGLGGILLGPLGGLATGLVSLLFGTSTKKTLQDIGLQFGAQTLQAILASGIKGKTYAQVLTETKKSFVGFTYSDSFSKKTTTGALDPEFAHQTTLLIASLREGVLSAASVLGIQGAEATLDAFKVDLGKISLKDLKGDEITKALEAVFGKVADGMASAVMPGLADFQKVGEGAFETLTRLARDYQVVDITLSSIGKTFATVGVASLTAREHLIGLFDSLDDFQTATAFYADNFMTEAEKLAPIQSAVTKELARLGLAGVTTRDQFKAVVQGLDLSTTAGADLFAALMNLAPAFAAVTEETKAISDAKSALSQAYDRESSAMADTRDKMRDLAKSFADYARELNTGPTAALTPEARYAAAQAEFQRVRDLALGGDQTALADLQGVSQEYLDASKAYFASSAGYFADLAAVKDAVTAAEGIAGDQADLAQEQLDAMKEQVGQLIDLNDNVLTVAEAIAELTALLAGTPYQGQAAALAAQAGASTSAGGVANDNTAEVVDALQGIRTAVETSNELTSQVAVETLKRLEALEQRMGTLVRVNEA